MTLTLKRWWKKSEKHTRENQTGLLFPAGTSAVEFQQGLIYAVILRNNAILKNSESAWQSISDSWSILSFISYSIRFSQCLPSISAPKVRVLPHILCLITELVSQELGNKSIDYKSLLYYTTLGSFGSGLTSCGLGDLNTNKVIEFKCSYTDAVLGSYETLEWGVSESYASDNQNDLTCDLYSVVFF